MSVFVIPPLLDAVCCHLGVRDLCGMLAVSKRMRRVMLSELSELNIDVTHSSWNLPFARFLTSLASQMAGLQTVRIDVNALLYASVVGLLVQQNCVKSLVLGFLCSSQFLLELPTGQLITLDVAAKSASSQPLLAAKQTAFGDPQDYPSRAVESTVLLLVRAPNLESVSLGVVAMASEPRRTLPSCPEALTHAALRQLELCSINLVEEALPETTVHPPNLRRLVLRHNVGDGSGVTQRMISAVQLFAANAPLEELELVSDGTTPFDGGAIRSLSRVIPKLRVLTMRGMDTLSPAAFASLLKNLPHLVSVAITNNSRQLSADLRSRNLVLDDVSSDHLAAALSHFHSFETLQLLAVRGSLEGDDLKPIVELCSNVTTIDLRFCSPTSISAGMFEPLTQLTSLHVQGVTPNSTAFLSDLRVLGNLRHLGFIVNSPLPDDVLTAIATNCPGLTTLAVGSLLRTTTALLALVNACALLTRLELCWEQGSFPTVDGEFGALSLPSVQQILRQIRPGLVVDDEGYTYYDT